MKKNLIALCSALFVMVGLFAGKLQAGESQNEYVTSRNAFSFSLVKALGSPDGNICISPYNISSALELAYFGAAGGTKSEISNTLHLPMIADSALASEIKKADQMLGSSAINARALAVDKTFLPTDSYLHMVKDTLKSDLFEVNFKKHPVEACDDINSWASKMTQGRITSLLEPANVSEDTQLVLLSSIYIKAAWANPFEVSQTQDGTFKTISGADKTVKMMKQTKNMRLFQNNDVQVVWRDLVPKTHNDARLEVVFVVPQDLSLLESVAKNISAEQLNSWDAQAESQFVELSVPRCSVRERLSVKKALVDLGMKQAFSTAADFSAISPKSDLMIDNVLHAAFMQLNEAGIEAAAATAVTITTRSLLLPEKDPIVVRCDKPFYVFVREKTTGLVLFVSLIASPELVEK